MGLFGKSKQEKAINLVETGSRGVGTVLSVQDTGVTMNDNPRVKMTFRIEPLDGSPPFDAEKTKTVSRVEIPRAGDRYPVWYDPNDADSWAFATVENDEGRASIRAMFGEAAETMTGIGNPMAAAPAAPARTRSIASRSSTSCTRPAWSPMPSTRPRSSSSWRRSSRSRSCR